MGLAGSRQERRRADVTEALGDLTFDLWKWFNSNYFARTSSSIKDVAPIFGFRWCVDGPGGMTSQGKVDVARGTGPAAEAARQWCPGYNEADVAAQAAIRDGPATVWCANVIRVLMSRSKTSHRVDITLTAT